MSDYLPAYPRRLPPAAVERCRRWTRWLALVQAWVDVDVATFCRRTVYLGRAIRYRVVYSADATPFRRARTRAGGVDGPSAAIRAFRAVWWCGERYLLNDVSMPSPLPATTPIRRRAGSACALPHTATT